MTSSCAQTGSTHHEGNKLALEAPFVPAPNRARARDTSGKPGGKTESEACMHSEGGGTSPRRIVLLGKSPSCTYCTIFEVHPILLSTYQKLHRRPACSAHRLHQVPQPAVKPLEALFAGLGKLIDPHHLPVADVEGAPPHTILSSALHASGRGKPFHLKGKYLEGYASI